MQLFAHVRLINSAGRVTLFPGIDNFSSFNTAQVEKILVLFLLFGNYRQNKPFYSAGLSTLAFE